MRLRRVAILLVLLVLMLTLASCAPGPNEFSGGGGDVAGFWTGLWHGIIAPVTFIISLFNDNVSMYEVHNNGGWYNFGFLFGAMTFWAGSGGGAARRGKR